VFEQALAQTPTQLDQTGQVVVVTGRVPQEIARDRCDLPQLGHRRVRFGLEEQVVLVGGLYIN